MKRNLSDIREDIATKMAARREARNKLKSLDSDLLQLLYEKDYFVEHGSSPDNNKTAEGLLKESVRLLKRKNEK